ncbi:hypothetical protein EV669_103393, partial [Gulbenkiania mobilis]
MVDLICCASICLIGALSLRSPNELACSNIRSM